MAKLLSENAQKVLAHLQANQSVYETANDIAEALGLSPRSVNGTVTGLQKKEFTVRQEVDGIDGKVIRLTDKGAATDPNADAPEAE